MTHCWGEDFPVDSPGLSRHVIRLVALAVADVVNDLNDNEFWGARRLLAAKVGVDPDTVSDVMKHLSAAGVIDVVERKPGRAVRYRWVWFPGAVSQPRGSGVSPPVPVGGSGDATVGVAVPPPPHIPKDPTLNPNPPSAAVASQLFDTGDEPLAPRKVATAIVNGYWEHVRAETGRFPRGVRHQALVAQVEPLVDEWDNTAIAMALARARSDCRPITGQVIEEYLDGRRLAKPQRRSAAMTGIEKWMEAKRGGVIDLGEAAVR